jgi:SSS family solute:Na+ symporter
VLGVGAAALAVAWALIHSQGTALALYYGVMSVVAGGLAGLYLLAFLSTRATRLAAYLGIAANLIFTLWTWLEQRKREPVDAQTVAASPAA